MAEKNPMDEPDYYDKAPPLWITKVNGGSSGWFSGIQRPKPIWPYGWPTANSQEAVSIIDWSKVKNGLRGLALSLMRGLHHHGKSA